MGTHASLKIKSGKDVIYMNTMNDGFPKEFIPKINTMVEDWLMFLSEIEQLIVENKISSPLLVKWIPQMRSLIDEYQKNPTVEVAAILVAETNFHLFRYVGWHTDEKKNKEFPIYTRLGEFVYKPNNNKVTKKQKPVQDNSVIPKSLNENYKLLRISYSKEEDSSEFFNCDFAVDKAITQEDLNTYLNEINSLEAQLYYLAETSSLKNNIVDSRFSSKNYKNLYENDISIKTLLLDMYGFDGQNARLIDLMRISGGGYYDLKFDTLGRFLCLVSAGKIRPLNESNMQWAKEKSNENVDFFIKQFEVNPFSNFRFCITRVPASGEYLKEKINAYNDFMEFVKSVYPDKKVLREYFIPEMKKPGYVDMTMTVDMIRFFEVFAKYPHEKPEGVEDLNRILPELYSAENIFK